MRKNYILYMVMVAFATVSARAQEISIANTTARKVSDDKVEVSFRMDCSGLQLSTRRQLTVTPIIVNYADSDSLSGMPRSLALPSVRIAGKNRYRMNERRKKLYGSMTGETPYMFRFSKKRRPMIEYSETVPAEKWMSGACVEVRREWQGCAGCGEVLADVFLADVPLFKEEKDTVERPHLELMVAEAVEKHRSFTRSAYLNFKAGQSVLLADYMNNPSELARIYSSIGSIRNDEIYRMDEISIVGYSSPEGSYVSNARLSEQRARALERNLKQAYKLDDRTLRCSSVAENWEGLAAWLEEYRPFYMQRVLDIIEQTPNPDARDAKIRAIDGGKIYNALLSEVYPGLRQVKYTVNYVIIPFTVEQGREIIRTRPDKMNHNEMYRVAESYGKGSEEYYRIIRMIAERFPDDRIAINNAAIVAWEMGDYGAMRMYLKRLEDLKAE